MHSMNNGGGVSNSQGLSNSSVTGYVSTIITDVPLNGEHQLLNP